MRKWLIIDMGHAFRCVLQYNGAAEHRKCVASTFVQSNLQITIHNNNRTIDGFLFLLFPIQWPDKI